MKWNECKQLIKADYIQLCGRRNRSHIQYVSSACKKLITNASFKITFWFRVGNYLREKRFSLCKPLYWVAQVIYKHNQFKTGIQLPLGTKVGGGLHFPHYGCQIIHYDVIMGENIHVFQGVTIGSMRGKGVPKIGNNVVLFSGARIIGNITIGDNVVIGAGAVVTKDVPSGSVVAGVPAKVVSQRGKEIVAMYIH